ncbi:MAG: ATP-binding protein [Chloroflexi bacterium]|nr:ATP-binding protein [Chloroflexota bacterium]
MVTSSADNQIPTEPAFLGTAQDWLAIIGSFADSITLIDEKGVVLFTNHQNYLAEAEVLVGDSVYSQFELSRQEMLQRYVDQVFQTGGPVRFEMDVAAVSGESAWYSFLLNIVKDSQQVTRAVVVKTDITGQKLAQDSRENSEKQSREAQRLASIAQFAAGVGHEINNPLGVIQGYTEMLLDGSHSEGDLVQLNNVFAASQRIKKVVSELNQLSRNTQPTKVLVNINSIVEQAISLKKEDFEKSEIKIIYRLFDGLPQVTADPYQLVQAILNVLTNAQKAIMLVGREGEIIITSSQDSGYVRLDISDNGSSIDPVRIDKAFDPFISPRDIGENAGLGLSVSDSIIRQNNGRLRVESDLDRGATFRLELPIETEG